MHLRQIVEPRRIEQRRRRDRHERGVGDMRAHVADPELHRLDLEVQQLRAVGRKPDDVEPFEDAERDQRRDALAVRRQLVDAVAEEFHVDRLDPVDDVRVEILRRDHVRRPSPPRARSFPPARRDKGSRRRSRRCFLKRCGMMGRAKMLAGLRRPAVRQERFGKAGLRMQPLDLVAPDHRDRRRDQKPVAGIADRRLEEIGEAAACRILRLSIAHAATAPGTVARVPSLMRHRRAR